MPYQNKYSFCVLLSLMSVWSWCFSPSSHYFFPPCVHFLLFYSFLFPIEYEYVVVVLQLLLFPLPCINSVHNAYKGSAAAHRSLICRPSTAHQTHSLLWGSAQTALSRSRHKTVGNHRAWGDKDGWWHKSSRSTSAVNLSAAVRNFHLNLKGLTAA